MFLSAFALVVTSLFSSWGQPFGPWRQDRKAQGPERNCRGLGGTGLRMQACLDPRTELGTCRAEVLGCGSCGLHRAHNPCSPHFPDLKERPLFPLNVLVKLFPKNSDLITAELRERNVCSPLPGKLRGSEGEGGSFQSGRTLFCAHSHHWLVLQGCLLGREVPCNPVLQTWGLKRRGGLTPQLTGWDPHPGLPFPRGGS